MQITVGLLKKAVEEAGKSRVLIDGFPRNLDNKDTFLNIVRPLFCSMHWIPACKLPCKCLPTGTPAEPRAIQCIRLPPIAHRLIAQQLQEASAVSDPVAVLACLGTRACSLGMTAR
jgi:hypothetical protein